MQYYGTRLTGSGTGDLDLQMGFCGNPQTGCGPSRRSVKDFVRRRRWIRTRVPIDSIEARQAGLASAAVSFDGPSPAVGMHDGLVSGASPPRLHEALSFPRRGALVRLLFLSVPVG